MATADLESLTSHEEITAFVDKIVEDRAGDDTSDAQKIAADAPVTEPPAEIASGSEDTAPEGEKAGEEATGQDWLDDDLKAEIAAYGIGEEELADFTSREELERALRFFDRSALEAGRKAMAKGDEGRDEHGRFVKKDAEPEKPKDGRYEIGLDTAVYDEGFVGELARMRDHYDARVAAMEARFAELDSQAEEQRFDGLVDGLGHADLFGKSGKENAKELQRRQDLFVAVKAQQLGLAQLNRSVDLDAALVNRVARMCFAEELGKKDLKSRTRKVFQQANGRMGGGATKPTDPAETLRDEMRRHYKELEGAG